MRRLILFRVSAVVLATLSVLAVSELLLRALPVADGALAQPVNAANPFPRLQPDRDFRFSKGWNFPIVTHKHTNNYGFLSDQDYTRTGKHPLLAVIGDSFVEAMQVANADALGGL